MQRWIAAGLGVAMSLAVVVSVSALAWSETKSVQPVSDGAVASEGPVPLPSVPDLKAAKNPAL